MLIYFFLKVFTTVTSLSPHSPTFLLLMAGRVGGRTAFIYSIVYQISRTGNIFFFCLPKGYTAIILYTFCNSDHNFQYLINIKAAMAGKVRGCDRATRPELFKQRTPPQSKKCFYKNLAEASDMPHSWGRVYNVQESFREQLLDTVIFSSYEGDAERCALGGLELAHPIHPAEVNWRVLI